VEAHDVSSPYFHFADPAMQGICSGGTKYCFHSQTNKKWSGPKMAACQSAIKNKFFLPLGSL